MFTAQQLIYSLLPLLKLHRPDISWVLANVSSSPVINPDLSGKTQHLSYLSCSLHTIIFMVVPTISFMVVPTIVFMVVQGFMVGLMLEDYLICRHVYHIEGPAVHLQYTYCTLTLHHFQQA